MPTYDIVIYQTSTLTTEKGRDPSYRLQDYLQAIFSNHVPDYSANVTIDTLDPTMYPDDDGDNDGYYYEQRVLDGHPDADQPCSTFNTSYNGIAYYFEDLLQCENKLPSDDTTVMVLLTSSESGGSGHTLVRSEQISAHLGNYAISVVENGYWIPDAPSTFTRYEPKDDSTAQGQALDDLQTATHEIGHGLIHDAPEDRVTEHETGAVTKNSTDYFWRTTLGLNGGTDSVCGSSYVRDGTARWDLTWAHCAQSYFQHPFK